MFMIDVKYVLKRLIIHLHLVASLFVVHIKIPGLCYKFAIVIKHTCINVVV